MSRQTREKIIVISGSCAPGTANDETLIRMLGENWRELTGATMSQETPSSSPGYRHAEAWEEVEREEREWRQRYTHDESDHASSSTRSTNQQQRQQPAAGAGGVVRIVPERGQGQHLVPGATCRRSSTDRGTLEYFFDCQEDWG